MSGGSQPRSPDILSLSSSMEVMMLSWLGEVTPLGVLFGVSSSDEIDCDTSGGADGYDPERSLRAELMVNGSPS